MSRFFTKKKSPLLSDEMIRMKYVQSDSLNPFSEDVEAPSNRKPFHSATSYNPWGNQRYEDNRGIHAQRIWSPEVKRIEKSRYMNYNYGSTSSNDVSEHQSNPIISKSRLDTMSSAAIWSVLFFPFAISCLFGIIIPRSFPIKSDSVVFPFIDSYKNTDYSYSLSIKSMHGGLSALRNYHSYVDLKLMVDDTALNVIDSLSIYASDVHLVSVQGSELSHYHSDYDQVGANSIKFKFICLTTITQYVVNLLTMDGDAKLTMTVAVRSTVDPRGRTLTLLLQHPSDLFGYYAVLVSCVFLACLLYWIGDFIRRFYLVWSLHDQRSSELREDNDDQNLQEKRSPLIYFHQEMLYIALVCVSLLLQVGTLTIFGGLLSSTSFVIAGFVSASISFAFFMMFVHCFIDSLQHMVSKSKVSQVKTFKSSTEKWFSPLSTTQPKSMGLGNVWLACDSETIEETNGPVSEELSRLIVSNTGLSVSHPLSPYFTDFIVHKALLFFITEAMTITYFVVLNSASIEFRQKQIILSTLRYSLLLVVIMWITWIHESWRKVGRELAISKYQDSRFQQLTYQVLSAHVSLGYLLCFGCIVHDLKQFYDDLKSASSASSTLIDLLVSMSSMTFKYQQWPLSHFYFFGLQVYIIVSALTLLYCLEPSLHVDTDAESRHDFVSLERYVGVSKVFCLETACRLMEASYQAYFLMPTSQVSKYVVINFNDDDATKSNKVAADVTLLTGPRIDSRRLGVDLIATMTAAVTNLFGFIGVSDDKSTIMVSFRGSIMANLYTDLKFSQISLPNLRNDRNYWERVIEEETLSDGNVYSKQGITPERSPMSPEVEEASPAIDIDISRLQLDDTSPSATATSSDSAFLRIMKCLPIVRQVLPRIHQGFWEAYLSIRCQYHHAIVRSLIASFSNDANRSIDNVSIQFSGHSLGGALANLAAFDTSLNWKVIMKCLQRRIHSTSYRKNYPLAAPIHLFTFGSPRIGNAAYAREVNALIPNYYRIELNGDIITMIPGGLFGIYQHAGIRVLVSNDEVGNILVDPNVVELRLWKSSQGSHVNHKLSKYRTCLEACFNPDDLREYLSNEVLATGQSNPIPAWMLEQRGPKTW